MRLQFLARRRAGFFVKVAICGERSDRREVAAASAAQIGAEWCLEVMGDVAIFHCPQADSSKRRIALPAGRGVDHVS